MAKRGRPKKKKVTYDSKETKFLLGLAFFALSAFSVLSYLILDAQSVFGYLRMAFGSVTLLFGWFSFNMALSLFGAQWFMNTRQSLLAQFFVTLLLAMVIAANAPQLLLRQQSYLGDFGGIVGYELAYFSQNYLFLNFTAPVGIVTIILLLPSLFSQSIADFFGNLFLQLRQLIASTREPLQDQPQPEQLEPAQTSPAMFSHFRGTNSQLQQPQQQPKPQPDQGINKNPDFVGLGKVHDGRPGGVNIQPPGSELDESGMNISSGGSLVITELKYPNWKLPPVELLDPLPEIEVPVEDVKNNSTIIEQTLASFGIESKVMDVMVGPSVTQYALDIALGIKVSKIANLRNDLALALATSANAVRIEVPIPGTSYVGIEIPNTKRRPVFFRELIEDPEMLNSKYMLPVSVGKGIAGNSVVADIQKMPHLLIAGATGSGKSVLTVSFILSLLMRRTPDEVRFILVDPKQVELSDFNDIPHLLTPVIVDMDKVLNALKWAVEEMERRYTLFREATVRNLEGYNDKMGFAALPFIVIVIDELADMMLTAGKVEIETNIVRLAQKARATGIHLILATQRPSVNVITGIIKANIPGRIGMSVTTGVDSRVIIDSIGAESLLGKGDMLFKEPDKNKAARVQGVFVSQPEVQRVVAYIKEQTEFIEYIDEILIDKNEALDAAAGGEGLSGDNMFADAVRVIVSSQKGSASLIQRKLSLGYNRAAKLIDEMEALGIVGPANGSKPREVLITDAEGFLAQLEQA